MQRNFLSILLGFGLILNTFESKAQRIDSVDVLHYKIEADIRHISTKQIQGTCTLTSVALFNQTRSLVLDLLKLPVTGVLVNNQAATFNQTDSTLHIALAQTYQKNDTLILVVQYAGSPSKDARWGGFYFSGDYAFNMGVGMASNPPNYGRCWYPCIDNFTDKATYEFHISTDSGYMAVCSGLQQPATPASNNGITWHWYLGQDIPTYIANVAVSKYALIEYSFQGMKRSIPVTIAVNPADTAKARISFMRLNNALQCFESRFGPYRFERVGYVGVPFNSGAMEHAGNISYPIYAIDGSSNFETLFAHELSHHWWGNLVTTRTASDMWLNEGFASYCEALFLECVYGKEAYDNKINSELFESLRWAHVRDGGYLPVSGVPLAQTYGTHVYTKGGLMVHSLRMLIQDDTAFFNTLTSYLNKYPFGNAGTQDLQAHFEKRFGNQITAFFNTYIYDKGHFDLQLAQIETHGSEYWILAYYQSRYKSVYPLNMPIYLYVNFNNITNSFQKEYLVPFYRNSDGTFIGKLKKENQLGGLNIISAAERSAMMNGVTASMEWAKGTTLKTWPNVLFSFTPTQNTDSSFVHVEHHFTGPFCRAEDLPQGIRISSERYWRVNGNWQNDFKATAFFNYDGTTPPTKNAGFLDNELILLNEDSLVLLYRPWILQPFEVLSDLTKQMGPSKTDKTGRFWVNDLKKGEYVFGYRDVTAGNQPVPKEIREMKLYPNPTRGSLNIELPAQHGSGKIQVINGVGMVVMENKVYRNLHEVSIQTTQLEKGTYFILFEDDKGKISKTFIAE